MNYECAPLRRLKAEPDAPGFAHTFDFLVEVPDRKIIGAAWLPSKQHPQALVLVGHGGSQHKRHESVLAIAKLLVNSYQFAVAAIDGPVHGANGSNPAATPKDSQREFLARWKTGDGGTGAMQSDWRATLSALLAEFGESLLVGYSGISMGTAYGLPLIARDARIAAAVIGMWGVDYPNSDQLLQAAQTTTQPILFIQRHDDELFTSEGSERLFEALATADKRRLILPGAHGESPEQFRQSANFLGERLSHVG